jgi:hypothetical protein
VQLMALSWVPWQVMGSETEAASLPIKFDLGLGDPGAQLGRFEPQAGTVGAGRCQFPCS